MLTVYILIAFTTFGGVSVSHTFYDSKSCEAAAELFKERLLRGDAFCAPDVIPKEKGI